MAKKDDLIAEANEIGLDLSGDETVAEIEAKMADHKAASAGAPVRRKVNRGSTRRIVRGLEAFDKAIAEFIKEIDLQHYIADTHGKRMGPSPVVEKLTAMREEIRNDINEILEG